MGSLRTPGSGETIASFAQAGGSVQETGAMVWNGTGWERATQQRLGGVSPNPTLDSLAESLESNVAGKLLRILGFNWDIKTSAQTGARYVGYEILGPEGHTFAEVLSPELKPSELYGICSFVGCGTPVAASVTAAQSRTVNLPMVEWPLPQGYKIIYIAPFRKSEDTFPIFRTIYEYI
jgi:hypothetical protein